LPLTPRGVSSVDGQFGAGVCAKRTGTVPVEFSVRSVGPVRSGRVRSVGRVSRSRRSVRRSVALVSADVGRPSASFVVSSFPADAPLCRGGSAQIVGFPGFGRGSLFRVPRGNFFLGSGRGDKHSTCSCRPIRPHRLRRGQRKLGGPDQRPPLRTVSTVRERAIGLHLPHFRRLPLTSGSAAHRMRYYTSLGIACFITNDNIAVRARNRARTATVTVL